MATSIGKLSKSFFVKLLVGIIILPFVFWGMGDVFRGGNQNVIATIDSKKVSTQEFVNHLRRLNLNEEQIKNLPKTNLMEKILSEYIGPKEIGIYPETGEMITLRKGPYGFYMQVGEGTKEKKPKRVSIPKNFEPDEIGLNTAIQLMGLPRKLGFHPETNKTVSAGIGMYGPYILHDKKYKALEKTDNILDIELERAIELIAKPTQRGNATLKTFGEHPTEKKNITAHDGKFGPYVKCGKINASILGDQTIDSLKLEDAIRLIDERKTKMGSKKKKKKVKN